MNGLDLQEIATKQDKSRYNRTKKKPSDLSYTSHSVGGTESEIHLLPLSGVPKNHQANSYNASTVDLMQTPDHSALAASVSVSPCGLSPM